MKIVETHKLKDGVIAYKLDAWPSREEKTNFQTWAHGNLEYYILLKDSYYEADMYGDVDHPAILLRPDTPENIKSQILLRWS